MQPLVIKKHWFAVSTSLFGGVFAAAGLFTLYAYFFLEITGDRWVALVIGPLFAIVGLSIVGYIDYISIDRQAGKITRTWGIFFPFKRKTYPLHQYKEVHTTRETRTRNTKNGTRTYQVYPVRLQGEEVLDIFEPEDRGKARIRAEDIARYLQLPLVREIDGEVFRREASELDLSLAERRRKEGEYTPMPAAPLSSEFRMSSEAGVSRFELKPNRSGFIKAVVAIVFGIPFFVFAGWFMGVFEQDEYDWFGYGFLVIFLLPLVFTISSQVLKAMVRPVLLLSPAEMVLEKKLLFTRRQVMQRGDIEELYLKGRHIIAISDKQTMAIPVLSRLPEDRDFVYNMILYTLGR